MSTLRQANRHIATIATLIVILLFAAASVAASENYYVYTDATGRTHIQDTLSHEAIRFGYRMVNSQGVTIKTVAPERSSQRRDSGSDPARDHALLQSYASLRDLEAARDKSIEVLQGRLDFARTQVIKLEDSYQSRKQWLAKLRSKGEAVPAKSEQDLQMVHERLERAEEVLIKLAVELEQLQQRYAKDIARFKVLTR